MVVAFSCCHAPQKKSCIEDCMKRPLSPNDRNVWGFSPHRCFFGCDVLFFLFFCVFLLMLRDPTTTTTAAAAATTTAATTTTTTLYTTTKPPLHLYNPSTL